MVKDFVYIKEHVAKFTLTVCLSLKFYFMLVK